MKTCSDSTSNASTVLIDSDSELPIKKRKLDKVHAFPGGKTLHQYLTDSRIGSHLVDIYNEHQTFTQSERCKLVHLISDALCEIHHRVSNEVFDSISENIVEMFPNELKSCYYIPPYGAKKISGGKIVERYRNQRKICSKSKSFMNDSSSSIDDVPHEECTDELEWLAHSSEPWARVITSWQKTHAVRLSESDSIHNYFNKFPALSCALGYNLVSINYVHT